MKRIVLNKEALFEDFYTREVQEAATKIFEASDAFDNLIRTHTRNVKSFESIKRKLDSAHEQALKVLMRYK